ncbi:MAG: MBL fold metallo-hydrolase [Planctomycetota bacterium]
MDRTAASLTPRLRFKTLASGSGGNASILIALLADPATGERTRHTTLIDGGLPPKTLSRALKEAGLHYRDVDDVLLTHLDHDHAHVAAMTSDKLRAPLHIHRRHLGRAERMGLLRHPTQPFDHEPFELTPQLRVSSVLLDHDQLGVAAFRIDCDSIGRSLAFATDLGRPTRALEQHLRGVDLLAIESNYCPEMQRASDRPAFLKRRIMDGAGHLSNEQATGVVRATRPREHVVLLHLSRQCNTPELASSAHDGASYQLTLTHQREPTPWIDLPARAPRQLPRVASMRQGLLFGATTA